MNKPARFISIFFLALHTLVHAQGTLTSGNFPPPPTAPVIYAVETNGQITIDGKLNEPAWQQTTAVSEFFRTEPRQGGSYLYKTYVKTLYDKKNLYFGVFCKDSAGRRGIRVQYLCRDFLFGENDIFFVQLDPQNLKRFCVSFQTTPYGNQRNRHNELGIIGQDMDKNAILNELQQCLCTEHEILMMEAGLNFKDPFPVWQ